MNTAKLTTTRSMKIWSIDGVVTLAKGIKTGKFVKKADAQLELNFHHMMNANNTSEALAMSILPMIVCLMAVITFAVTKLAFPEGLLQVLVAFIMSLFFAYGVKGIVAALSFYHDKPAV